MSLGKNAILALDQGTHATRAIVFDGVGNALCEAQKKISLNRLDDFRVEQDPGEILASVRYVIQKALKSTPPDYRLVCAGLATQRSSVVAFQKSGMALGPMLSWQDRRTTENIQEYTNEEFRIKKITGLPLSPHYGATKMRWLLENVSEVLQARRENDLILAPLASYIIYNLLDEAPLFIDHANASRSLLLNLQTANWDDFLLRLFSIPRELLPVCVPTCFHFGHIQGIPLMALSGDQNAALFSEGDFPKDAALVNIGTGAFVLKPLGMVPVSHERLLSGLLSSADGVQGPSIEYALEGTVNGAASAFNWAKEHLGIKHAPDINAILKIETDIPLFINRVGGIGSPYWNAEGTSEWIGASSDNYARMVAVLESILFYIKINIDEIKSKNIEIGTLFVTGGMSRADALCQNLANLCQMPVTRFMQPEATARGIAFLAAGRPVEWRKTSRETFWPGNQNSSGILTRFRKFKEQF